MARDLWGEFLDYCRDERRLAERTIETFSSRLKRVERELGRPFLHDPESQPTTIEMRALMRQDVPWETLRGMVVAVKAWHRWGALEELWPLNGLVQLKVPSEPSDPEPPLTRRQARSLLRNCHTSREYRLVFLGLYAGCRISESTRMDAECWQGNRLHFRKSKSRRPIEIPIHPVLANVQDKILAVQDLKPQTLGHTMRRMRLRTNFWWTSNALRRTFATTLLEAGEPLWLVEALMGHAPSSMTLKAYVTLPISAKVSAIARLRY